MNFCSFSLAILFVRGYGPISVSIVYFFISAFYILHLILNIWLSCVIDIFTEVTVKFSVFNGLDLKGNSVHHFLRYLILIAWYAFKSSKESCSHLSTAELAWFLNSLNVTFLSLSSIHKLAAIRTTISIPWLYISVA